jgi:hypothetical protein
VGVEDGAQVPSRSVAFGHGRSPSNEGITCAARGHAAAAPLRRAMNSRRFTAAPEPFSLRRNDFAPGQSSEQDRAPPNRVRHIPSRMSERVIFDRFNRFCLPAHFRFDPITDLRLD